MLLFSVPDTHQKEEGRTNAYTEAPYFIKEHEN